eukprot:5783122-Prymnesium_polylepis.1
MILTTGSSSSRITKICCASGSTAIALRHLSSNSSRMAAPNARLHWRVVAESHTALLLPACSSVEQQRFLPEFRILVRASIARFARIRSALVHMYTRRETQEDSAYSTALPAMRKFSSFRKKLVSGKRNCCETACADLS